MAKESQQTSGGAGSIFRKQIVTTFVLLCLFIVVFVMSVAIGPIVIPFGQTLSTIAEVFHLPFDSNHTEQQRIVVTEVRLPRTIVASLVGAALAVAGAALQGLFRNPLIEPGYVGVSSGAALGAVTAIFFGWTAINSWFLTASAFFGALIATAIILLVWKSTTHKNITMLILLGIGINSFFSAVMNVMVATSENEQELRSIVYWLQGGLEARTWDHVWLIILPIFIGIAALIFLGKELNMLLLGDELAKSSGVNVRLTRNIILLLTAIVTGTAVSVSGIIGFVGLIVPHILRFIIGSDHRLLLPASAIGGATFLVLADLISRIILQPITLQVGVICALIGAPLFIYLILRTSKGAEL